jgi:hypothetical protein
MEKKDVHFEIFKIRIPVVAASDRDYEEEKFPGNLRNAIQPCRATKSGDFT